ncbi:DsbA family protein [Paraflavitalea pollutisoli]|uniref:DsbA family protein n=1 Tax=Paraflavitalea pollutisoli TaxID=3034143 RepID=UPI0023EC724A|nr:thioredoxin domain-containing protein [Paraflavitalea sp. H1-2-19X]
MSSSFLTPSIGPQDHVYGNENAVIELVEYGDYQCPYCGRAYPIIKNIQEQLGSALRFGFRNFPLSKVHPNAFDAAVAAEAAALQGKFWEMHDIIFENQHSLELGNIVQLARSIGLNTDRFKEDLQLPAVIGKVKSDFESGVRSGVNRTPSFFINGNLYTGDWQGVVLLEYLKNQLPHRLNGQL